MKRIINVTTILLLALSSLLVTACGSKANTDNAAIIRTAYESLDDNHKRGIIGWEKAEVEKHKCDEEDHKVLDIKTDSLVNLKGTDAYRVTFKTESDGLSGPVTVYLNKNSYKILGVDLGS